MRGAFLWGTWTKANLCAVLGPRKVSGSGACSLRKREKVPVCWNSRRATYFPYRMVSGLGRPARSSGNTRGRGLPRGPFRPGGKEFTDLDGRRAGGGSSEFSGKTSPTCEGCLVPRSPIHGPFTVSVAPERQADLIRQLRGDVGIHSGVDSSLNVACENNGPISALSWQKS